MSVRGRQEHFSVNDMFEIQYNVCYQLDQNAQFNQLHVIDKSVNLLTNVLS
jgi:hypothetical protein